MTSVQQRPVFFWKTSVYWILTCGVFTVHPIACHGTRTEALPIIFPSDEDPGITPRTHDGPLNGTSHRIAEIPDSLLFRMRNVRNLTDFVSQFLDGYSTYEVLDSGPYLAYLHQGDDDLAIQDSGEHSGVEGKRKPSAVNIPDPEPGTCMPSKQLVEFPKSSDPTVILWPPCTRIARCGGCCPSTILTCTPTATSNITYKVIKAQYRRPGAAKFNFMGHEFVTLERHDRCGCECKQGPSDCNRLQRYEECRCICTNTLEMQHCEGPDRVWDHTLCRCMCKDYAECSTGFYYNSRSCRCEVLHRSRIGSRVFPQLRSPYADDRESGPLRNHFLNVPAQEEVLGHYSSLQHGTTRMTRAATTLSAYRSWTRT